MPALTGWTKTYDVSQIPILDSSVNSETRFGNRPVVQLKFISKDELDLALRHGIKIEYGLFQVTLPIEKTMQNTIVKALVILLEIVLIQLNLVIIVTVTGAVNYSPLPMPTMVTVIEATVCRVQRSPVPGHDARNGTISRAFNMSSIPSKIVSVFFPNINGSWEKLVTLENLLFKYDIVCLAKHLLNLDNSNATSFV